MFNVYNIKVYFQIARRHYTVEKSKPAFPRIHASFGISMSKLDSYFFNMSKGNRTGFLSPFTTTND